MDQIREYFRARRAVLLAASGQAVTTNGTINGSYREDIIRFYFSEVLPTRYSIGTGKIVGKFHESGQIDVIISDALNFPNLPLAKSSEVRLAESCVAAIEIKSNYSFDILCDIVRGTERVLDIVPSTASTEPLVDELLHLRQEISALRDGVNYAGFAFSPHHIATSAIVFHGGQKFSARAVEDIAARDPLDNCWPDLLLLLEPGIICVKDRDSSAIRIKRYNDDSLFLYTAYLFDMIAHRSAYHPNAEYLLEYARFARLTCEDLGSVSFKLTRPSAGRVSLEN
jgi:hypothetical protein